MRRLFNRRVTAVERATEASPPATRGEDCPAPLAAGACRAGTSTPEAAGTPGPTREQIAATLEHSVGDACAQAVTMGAGEAFFGAYAVALGASSAALGLQASLPTLLGSLAQTSCVWVLGRATRRLPLMVYPALLQALCWMPLYALPLAFPAHALWFLLAAVCVYTALGAFGAPAWSSLIGELVDPLSRGRYFGRRSRLRMGFQLGAVVSAGSALTVARYLGAELAGFGVIFLAAMLARFLSVRHLAAHTETLYRIPDQAQHFTLRAFLRRIPKSNFGRFTVFVAAMMGATSFASPFFTLYMLRDLGFDYFRFTIASTAMLGAQVATFQNWGRVADRIGSRRVMTITGFLIALVPLLWLTSTAFPAIVAFQAISGVVWAGFNLSTANFIFDSVTPPKRPRCVAYYNLLQNVGTVAGSVSGGLLAPLLPASFTLFGREWQLASSLLLLFAASGLLRLLVALTFLPLLREVRTVEKTKVWEVFVQVTGLSAIRGFRFGVFGGLTHQETQMADESERITTMERPRKQPQQRR
ncbi:MAG: MFS transporter [Candidatus Schekmanbacteria bacterium]|nr:MFS transporter [Candidatus Schekmanbacteria bacterium]